jgi:uncharacterized protein
VNSKAANPRRPRSALALGLLIAFSARADLKSAQEAYAKGDHAAAAQEFLALAEQGDSNAQASLGALYEAGDGVAKDPDQARQWYEKSAEQGNDNGQYRLGSLYFNGTGVEKDLVTACTWFSIATNSGHGGARNSMQYCAKYLDEKQRNEYFQRSQRWLAEHKRGAK